jgi:serine/threonine-protein kinase RsbW
MAHTQSLSLLPRNAHSVPFVELRQSLPTRIAVVSPFVDQLIRFILKFRIADGSESDIEMALLEALANAVIHGNGDNSGERVYVTCRCYLDGEVAITVQDEGKGFDSSAVLDPTFPENLLFTHGRGIYLMKTLMDAVSFEDSGSVVRMRKNSNSGRTTQRRSGVEAGSSSSVQPRRGSLSEIRQCDENSSGCNQNSIPRTVIKGQTKQ